MSVTAFRPIAICLADRPVCPRCGRVAFGSDPHIKPAGTLIVCRRGRGGEHCAQRMILFAVFGGLTAVVALTADEYRAIEAGDKNAKEVLRDLGQLVEVVSERQRAG